MSERFCTNQHIANEHVLIEFEEYWQKMEYETFRVETSPGWFTLYRKKPCDRKLGSKEDKS